MRAGCSISTNVIRKRNITAATVDTLWGVLHFLSVIRNTRRCDVKRVMEFLVTTLLGVFLCGKHFGRAVLTLGVIN
jgi:hypothetical protein